MNRYRNASVPIFLLYYLEVIIFLLFSALFEVRKFYNELFAVYSRLKTRKRPEMPAQEIKKIAWNAIVGKIRKGRSILILGPGAYLADSGKTLQAEFESSQFMV
jgi:hypothetical protein